MRNEIRTNDRVSVIGDDRASRIVVRLYTDADGNNRAICADQIGERIDVRVEAVVFEYRGY